MLKIEFVGKVILANDFWDCQCINHYINRKSEKMICSKCGAEEGESPDSQAEEVLAYYPELTVQEKWELIEAIKKSR